MSWPIRNVVTSAFDKCFISILCCSTEILKNKSNYLMLLYLIETTKSVLLLCKIKNFNLIIKKKSFWSCVRLVLQINLHTNNYH